MIKPTKSNLKKIELILNDIGYSIIYDKGSFKSGYCIVEDRKLVVINKFLQTESRINTILDIIASLDIDTDKLTPTAMKAYLLVSSQFENAYKSLENDKT